MPLPLLLLLMSLDVTPSVDDAPANFHVDSRVFDDAISGKDAAAVAVVAAAAAAVVLVTPLVDDPLQTIAGRRDSPGRESEGDISARRHLSLRGVVVPSSFF